MAFRWVRVGGPSASRRGIVLGLLVLAVFVAGVAAGSVTVNFLPAQEKSDLGRFLDGSMAQLLDGGAAVPSEVVFGRALAHHLKTAGLLWVLGLFLPGIPLILVLLFMRGFLTGFTVGFLVYQRGWNGLLMAMAVLVPPNLVAVPALLAIGVAGIAHALRRRPVLPGRPGLSPELVTYTLFTGAMALLLVVASLLEGYLAPFVLRTLAGHL